MKLTGNILIDGRWQPGNGEAIDSSNPAAGASVWHGSAADRSDVDAALIAAANAAADWARRPSDQRIAILRAFQEQLRSAQDWLAELISRETGKPLWESHTEIAGMIAKVDISIRAWDARCPPYGGRQGDLHWSTHYRPHGVMAVLGPFNFPGHLPNGHIVPALLAGNAVVFKPSDRTPAVGEACARLWEQAGLPEGVLTLLHGGGNTGRAIVEHAAVNAILFTGSYATGKAIHRLLAGRPEVLLALEMGGNNPLVIGHTQASQAALYIAIASAFATTGQRCTCARRLILIQPEVPDTFLPELIDAARRLRQDAWNSQPDPFMGPLIDKDAATAVASAQQQWIDAGAKPLLRAEQSNDRPAFISPGIIDTTGIDIPDQEIFGPLLQVIRVPDLDAAIHEANRTAYGLAAAYVGDNPAAWQAFHSNVRAGVINWNRQTTGARGDLPFGGVGHSGNHRPAAWFAADYCAWPMASITQPIAALPSDLPPGLNLTGDPP